VQVKVTALADHADIRKTAIRTRDDRVFRKRCGDMTEDSSIGLAGEPKPPA